MPLHDELEYENLHYTHPRHLIPSGVAITIQEETQYLLFGTLTLGSSASITLEPGANIVVI